MILGPQIHVPTFNVSMEVLAAAKATHLYAVVQLDSLECIVNSMYTKQWT